MTHTPTRHLFVRQENGRYRPATPVEIDHASAEQQLKKLMHKEVFGSPDALRRFLKARMHKLEHEVFAMLILDNRNRLIEYNELFRGTIDGASVHPREVVKEVLKKNGAAVILAHNHPSGVAEPSHADEVITRKLKAALGTLDIRLLDHMVVGDTTVSFAERGLI